MVEPTIIAVVSKRVLIPPRLLVNETEAARTDSDRRHISTRESQQWSFLHSARNGDLEIPTRSDTDLVLECVGAARHPALEDLHVERGWECRIRTNTAIATQNRTGVCEVLGTRCTGMAISGACLIAERYNTGHTRVDTYHTVQLGVRKKERKVPKRVDTYM